MQRRNRERRGFIVLFGWRTISTREGTPEVIGKCPGCGVEDARLIGRLRRAWFTLFFVPVVPMDSKARSQRISQCRECKQMFELPIEQIARRAGAQASRNVADTIAAYNDLRDQPNDGKIMLKLLKMYADLGELGEAESVARHFPIAMAADPACGVLLDKMRRAERSDALTRRS